MFGNSFWLVAFLLSGKNISRLDFIDLKVVSWLLLKMKLLTHSRKYDGCVD
jgi:hypothetical protein